MSRTGCPDPGAVERGAAVGSGEAGTMDPDVGVARTDAQPGCGGGAMGGSAAAVVSLGPGA